jgi:hypothetical protein
VNTEKMAESAFRQRLEAEAAEARK